MAASCKGAGFKGFLITGTLPKIKSVGQATWRIQTDAKRGRQVEQGQGLSVPGAISWADQSASGNRRAAAARADAVDAAAVAQPDQVWSSLADGRRQATVLFADIVASSHLVGGADPEDARDRLRAILELMEAQITRFGGTLCPTLGDGVMAVFGSPRAQEDHAIRACFAADAIVAEAHRSVQGDGPAVPRRSLPFNVRVGVASGEILWDNTGHRTGGRPAAVGEPVHLAAKLQQTAPINGIRLAGSTASLVPEWVEAEAAGTFDLSPQRRVALFEQKAVFQIRRAAAEATPFVGRERLVAQLRAVIAALAAGRGSAHLIQGDAGMGKTRLVRHVLDQVGKLRTLYWAQQQVRAVGAPEPLAQVLADLLGEETLTCRVALERALAASEGLSPAAAEALADTLFPAASGDGGIPATTRLRSAAEAVVHLALREARRQPLLIVVEDLHWAGSEVTAVVERLAARAIEGRVLLLATSRQLPDGSQLGETVKIHKLYPLPESAAAALFHHATATSPQLVDAAPALIARAHGNPFYLVQYVQALLSNPNCAGADALLGLPPTVQGLLAARIDGLADAERGVLWAASVVGQTVDTGLLAVLLGSRPADALAALSRLTELGFLEKTRILPRIEFTFRHALIHEAAYTTLTKRDRRGLHRKLAEALLADWAADLPGRDEAIARHGFAGESWELALEYGWKAGLAARAQSRAREAFELLGLATSALTTLELVDPSGVLVPTAMALRLDRIRTTMATGRRQDVDLQLKRVLETARQVGDVGREALALTMQSTFEWVYGSLRAAQSVGEQALKLARLADDSDVLFEALIRLGVLNIECGAFRRAVDCLVEADHLLTADPSCDRLMIRGRVYTLSGLARCRAEFGDRLEALRLARLSRDYADQESQLLSRMYAAGQMGITCLVLGDYKAAGSAMEDCIALGDLAECHTLRSVALGGLGLSQVQSGDRETGLANLRVALGDLASREMTADRVQVEIWQAMALASDDHRAATIAAHSAAERAAEMGSQALLAWALYAEAISYDHASVEALALHQAAKGKAEELGLAELGRRLAAHKPRQAALVG